MKICDLIDEKSVSLMQNLPTREAVIKYMVKMHSATGNIESEEEFAKALCKRELMGTTAVGGGIAIPHAKSDAVKKAGLCAVTLKEGVDWGSPDNVGANLIFMIAAPEEGDEHLQLLSRLVTMLMNKSITRKLMGAQTAREFIAILEENDRQKYESIAEPETPKKPRIVAVTACPTGIAHTYMAAEALMKAAENIGVVIKVETDGSAGAENVLSAEDIRDAEAVIVAADRQVEMSRFEGKRLMSVSTSDAIHHSKEVINRAQSGDLHTYHHRGEKKKEGSVGATGFRAVYGYLMNGVSHMLPFVVAGGLFIAVSFLIDTVLGVPQGESFGSTSAASGFLNQIGGIVFKFMLPVLSGYIAIAIGERPAFLPGFAGGYLAYIGSTFAKPSGNISSGFLGALFAGFAAGALMLFIEKMCEKIPKSLEGLRPVLIYPLLGLILISLIVCGVNPLMGIVNKWITAVLESLHGTSAVLFGIVLGAMMAFDMGGPVNKAAYVFGTASIASGNLNVMAAVMAGGMVPPLAIALATNLFPKKFSPEERKNGTVNYVLGLSFITEGAIPYAAADPLRVIPSCMIGSAVAGGGSMLFNCTLGAPHGGIFVLPVVGNRIYYFISIAAGCIVGALLLGLLKNKYVGAK